MNWSPSDLVSDDDLLAYEGAILTLWNKGTWQTKRQAALQDWLWPILRAEGYAPRQLRTRVVPHALRAYTAAAWSTPTEPITLSSVWATVATDYLYIGSQELFTGLWVELLESVSAVTAALTVQYWGGAWKTLPIADGTKVTAGKTLSGGGSVRWVTPENWDTRDLDDLTAPYYWVRVSVSAKPTGAIAQHLGVIRDSVLRPAAIFRTLALIFHEAPLSSEGPWTEKAEFYEREAAAAMARALPLVGAEMDVDDSNLVDTTEAEQTGAEAGQTWSLERG